MSVITDKYRSGKNHWPAVSVIVPVYNAESTIDNCVRALFEQDYPDDKMELILIDNGSTDQSRNKLVQYGDRIKLFDQPERGASAARNTGIRQARHALIAMTDADCIPQPNWLRALIDHAKKHPDRHFVGGKITSIKPASAIQLYAETLFDQQKAIEVYHPPYMITANVLIQKKLLFKYGMFNHNFPRSQDVELSFRAGFHHDAKFTYCNSAVVEHYHVNTPTGVFHKGMQHGRGSANIRRSFKHELGAPRSKRLVDISPYCDLIRYGLYRCLKSSPATLLSNSEHVTVYSFCDALFRCGYHLGLLRGTLSHLLTQLYRNGS